MSDNNSTEVRCGECSEVYDTSVPQNFDENGTPCCPVCDMPVTLPSTTHVTKL